MRVSNLSLLAVCVLMCACARTSIESSIVFAEGSDSCHFYRIPAMTLDSQGNVVAVIDRRYESLADLGYRTTSIDISCRRSSDGGYDIVFSRIPRRLLRKITSPKNS